MVQPAAAIAEVCRGLGVPLVIDAAQSLGHIDCVVGAMRSTRPRASGWPDWDLPLTVLQRLENGEAIVAARVGLEAFAEALAEATEPPS